MRKLHVVLAGLACVAFALPAFTAIPKESDIKEWIKGLSNKDPKVRAEAAKELGHAGLVKKSLVKDAMPALLDATKDADINVKIQAWASMGQMGAEAEKLVPMLISELGNKDTKIVVAAAQTLGYYGPAAEDALPTLKKLADDNAVPRNNKEAEAKFGREELNKRRTIGRAVGDAMRNIGGGKKK